MGAGRENGRTNVADSNKPEFLAYSVIEKGGGERPYWHKVGAVFPNKGGGYTLILDSLPFDRRVVLRKPSDTAQAAEDEGSKQTS